MYVRTCVTYICRLEKDLNGKELELIKAKQQCESLQSSIVQQNEELKQLHKRYVFTYMRMQLLAYICLVSMCMHTYICYYVNVVVLCTKK